MTTRQESETTFAATGADAVAHALKAARVTRVFALCGDHVNSLFHALHRVGIEIVGARHESAAIQMADGSARATGKPGVAIVTGGPGHTNAVTGAAVAQGAQSPVVIISGQATKTRRERGGNQSLHQAEIMRPVTKWAIEAEDSAALGELTLRALTVASSGTPGAVSLSIPVDVADGTTEARPLGHSTYAISAATTPTCLDIGQAVRLLAEASKPVLVLGGSAAQHMPYDQLATAVKRLGIPTFTNGHARGVIADDGEYCFGHASPLFNAMFGTASECDLWVVVGTTVDYSIAPVVSAAAPVIQLHSDPRQIGVGRIPDCALVSPPVATLSAIADACDNRPGSWSAWRSVMRNRYAAQQAYWADRAERRSGQASGIHPATLCRLLRPHHTPQTTLVVDVGDFVNWPKAYFPALAPARYMDGGALGNLGGALPVAIGAAIARPEHPVWAFTGDGGFGFHSWELSVAVEHKLPLRIIVGNDRAWGTEKRLQRKGYGVDIACDLPQIRYDAYAKLLGVDAYHAANAEELPALLTAMNACEGPCLLDMQLAVQAGRPYADLRFQ